MTTGSPSSRCWSTPSEHWRHDRESRTFHRTEGRRPAGYVKATPGSKSFDDPGVFVPLALPNQVRTRVAEWRAAGCPGITGVTERLLRHWRERSDWEEAGSSSARSRRSRRSSG